MGDLGSKLPPSANKTKWVAGTYVEVAWGPLYNHGGGYQVGHLDLFFGFLFPVEFS